MLIVSPYHIMPPPYSNLGTDTYNCFPFFLGPPTPSVVFVLCTTSCFNRYLVVLIVKLFHIGSGMLIIICFDICPLGIEMRLWAH
jgi:hypothetical protein